MKGGLGGVPLHLVVRSHDYIKPRFTLARLPLSGGKTIVHESDKRQRLHRLSLLGQTGKQCGDWVGRKKLAFLTHCGKKFCAAFGVAQSAILDASKVTSFLNKHNQGETTH